MRLGDREQGTGKWPLAKMSRPRQRSEPRPPLPFEGASGAPEPPPRGAWAGTTLPTRVTSSAARGRSGPRGDRAARVAALSVCRVPRSSAAQRASPEASAPPSSGAASRFRHSGCYSASFSPEDSGTRAFAATRRLGFRNPPSPACSGRWSVMMRTVAPVLTRSQSVATSMERIRMHP